MYSAVNASGMFMAIELEPRKPVRIRSDVYKHVELAEKLLSEGRELIYRDPVQASEKLYKAAEEAVKALAKAFNLPQVDEAEKIGRWTAELLFRAVNALAKKLGDEIYIGWHTAWFLHVEGFHEVRLDSDYIAANYSRIETIVNLMKKIVKEKED
jgi:hypothetical protein